MPVGRIAIDGLDEVVSELTARRVFCDGLQMYVAHEDDVLVDAAWGRSSKGPMSTSHLHSSYCLSKPVLALAVAAAVEQGYLSFDGTVDLWPGGSDREALPTVGGLLTHAAGLTYPTLADWRLASEDERQDLIWSGYSDETVGYSEVAAWTLLVLTVLQAGGQELLQSVVSMALPKRIQASLMFSPPGDAARSRLRVPVAMRGGSAVPLLSERLPSQLRTLGLATGALTSAQSVGEWYRHVGHLYTRGHCSDLGLSAAGLHDLLSHRRDETFDHRLGRTCTFVGGFMGSLASHGFGAMPTANAFGHTAGITSAFAFYDPLKSLSVSVYMNGALPSQGDMDFTRQRLVSAIYGGMWG